jgi:integrase
VGKLTANFVKSAKPRDGKVTTYPDGQCLYLQVAPGKADKINRSWTFRYFSRAAGRERVMGLGPWPAVGLADKPAVNPDGSPMLDATGKQIVLPGARTLAAQARAMVAAGIDPLEAKRASRPAKSAGRGKSKEDRSFGAAAAGYLAEFEKGWKSARHADQWHQSLRDYVLPALGKLDCDTIDTAAVRRVLDQDVEAAGGRKGPLWAMKPESASRIRGRIETVLDFAKVAHGFSWSLQDGGNPARWKGHLEFMYSQRNKQRDQKHLAAMPDAEIGAFMIELRSRTEIAARALEFAILTAARTSEVIDAPWDEIDLEAKLWRIPAVRMKRDNAHEVALSDAAIAVLEFMGTIRQDDRIFACGEASMRLLLKQMRPTGCDVHGFRSTFSDWAGDCSDHPRDVVEMAMAHKIRNKVEAAYRRRTALQKRAKLMADWADHCGRVAGDNVVSLDGSLAREAKQA